MESIRLQYSSKPWPHTVLVTIRGSQNKTKGCGHRKGAVGGKDGRGRREMRELG